MCTGSSAVALNTRCVLATRTMAMSTSSSRTNVDRLGRGIGRSILAAVPFAFALYVVVAAVVLFVWHRRVTAMSRVAALVLMAMPLLFTGPALVTNRAYGPYDLLYIVDPFQAYG